MKKNKSTIILILVFFVGLSVMLYPTISDYVNQRNQSRAVASYAQDVDNMTDADYSAYFDAADAFNAQVAANENALYRPDQLTGYNETLDITGTGIMGYITISKIGVELPIYHGTSDSVLQIAAGHLEGTSLPVGGASTHAVISAHRGLPSAKLFTNLDQLEVGDTFTITVLDRVLTYEVDKISIVLPTETDDDIKGIASLAQRAYDRAKAAVPPEQRGSVRMSVSCAVFVPKAQTPFQWDGQISPEETLRRVGLLKRSVKYKAVDVHYHDPATSFVEAVMSRGGREVADWVEAAWRRGARFDAWTELFNEEAWTGAAEELGLDPAAIAQAEFPTDYVLPWAHITAAVSPKFLARERERAAAGVTTPDCTFENCSACGACPTLGVDIELQQEREGKEAAPAANPYRKVVHPREAEPPCHPDQARQAEGSTEEEAIR